MYEYVINKYKNKYKSIVNIDEKSMRSFEEKSVFNWLGNFNTFYENLKVLTDFKVILAKEKYILCEFTYLL